VTTVPVGELSSPYGGVEPKPLMIVVGGGQSSAPLGDRASSASDTAKLRPKNLHIRGREFPNKKRLGG